MLILYYYVVNIINRMIFLIESSTVIGTVTLTSPVTKIKAIFILFNDIKPKFYIFRNQKSVSDETTNLYLLNPNLIYTGSTSLVVLDLMD